MHQRAGYQLEKNFCYLSNKGLEDSSFDVLWGLEQAKAFAASFAKKWVNINVNNMSRTEIQFLVSAVMLFRKEEQEKED